MYLAYLVQYSRSLSLQYKIFSFFTFYLIPFALVSTFAAGNGLQILQKKNTLFVFAE